VQAERYGLTLSGDNALTFALQGDRYEMTGQTTAAGGLYRAVFRSSGTVAGGVLRPVTYAEKRGSKGEQRTDLDWTADRVTFSGSDPAPTQPQMQDRLTLLLQVGWTWRLQPKSETLQMPVAGTRRASVYQFVRRGTEALNLPRGTTDTVRIERIDSPDDRIEVWVAPSLCWLPARVRYKDVDGNVIDQRLQRVRLGS
jgi:hypothetical protein